MTTFDTPEPIRATIELAAGSLRVNAGDRADTHVQVSPRNPGSAGDIAAAEHTHVSYTGGHLVVTTPRHTSFATGGTVEVTVDLPAGSQLNARSEAGDLRTTARLDVTTQYGTVRNLVPPTPGGESIAVRAETGYGDIVVGHS